MGFRSALDNYDSGAPVINATLGGEAYKIVRRVEFNLEALTLLADRADAVDSVTENLDDLLAAPALAVAARDAAQTASGIAASVAGTATLRATEAEEAAVDAVAAASKLTGTSPTSVLIGTGSKSFVSQANKSFEVGRDLKITSDSSPTTLYMFGTVTAYNASAGALTIDVTALGGAGTYTDWTIRIAGVRGAQGVQGIPGISWEGVWDDEGNYIVGDLVRDVDALDAPAIWISKSANLNKKPRDYAADWDLFLGS